MGQGSGSSQGGYSGGQQSYGQQQGNSGSTGYAGGYNPQPMSGSTYSPGPPGWNMRLGAGGQDYTTAAQPYLTPGAPQWLQTQMGQYVDQPFATDPNQYGRWNWGTNMQGQGIPSPFGQYAQRQAQYPGLTFPPVPPPAGGGPGQPPQQPPAPPPGAPPTNQPPNLASMSNGDLVRYYSNLSNSDPNFAAARAAIEQRSGGGDQNAGQLINQYNAGGTNYDFQKSGNAYQQAQLADPAMQAWLAANPSAAAAMRAGKV